MKNYDFTFSPSALDASAEFSTRGTGFRPWDAIRTLAFLAAFTVLGGIVGIGIVTLVAYAQALLA